MLKSLNKIKSSIIQESLNKLYSKLYGNILISKTTLELEEEDITLQMKHLGLYDDYQYKYLTYENFNN